MNRWTDSIVHRLSAEVVMYLPESISSSDTPRYSSGMSNSGSECSAEFNQINIEQGDKGQSVITF